LTPARVESVRLALPRIPEADDRTPVVYGIGQFFTLLETP
jgi:hypothetical protein